MRLSSIQRRYTKDLDMWISTDTANAEAVYKSLPEFGAPLAGLTTIDFAEEGCFFQMGIPPIRVDIIMGIPGAHLRGAGRDETKWILTAWRYVSSPNKT
jgi:hypothetical protein